jgi:ribokinase
VDTVGAGDTLVGALVTALAEGQAIEAALRFAQAAAAIAVSRPGVQDAMPTRAEVIQFLEAAP